MKVGSTEEEGWSPTHTVPWDLHLSGNHQERHPTFIFASEAWSEVRLAHAHALHLRTGTTCTPTTVEPIEELRLPKPNFTDGRKKEMSDSVFLTSVTGLGTWLGTSEVLWHHCKLLINLYSYDQLSNQNLKEMLISAIWTQITYTQTNKFASFSLFLTMAGSWPWSPMEI